MTLYQMLYPPLLYIFLLPHTNKITKKPRTSSAGPHDSPTGVTSTLAVLTVDRTLRRFDVGLLLGGERPAVADVGVVGVGMAFTGSTIVGVTGEGVMSVSRDWACATTVWWGRMLGSDICRGMVADSGLNE